LFPKPFEKFTVSSTMVVSTQPQAGPSNPNRKRKQNKPGQKPLKTGKLKKTTEQQKLDALERDATNFVSEIAFLPFLPSS